MRLIDGDALVQKLRSTYINEIFTDWDLMDKKDQNIILKLMKGYKDIVYSIPAVDAVPVVRCRECEYAKNAKVNKKGFRICPASHMEIVDDDYCSYGERETNGQGLRLK